MKKILLFLFICSILTGCAKEQISNEKYSCNKESDCVLSERDPDGFATCVNKQWNEDWNSNPESKQYLCDCFLTGKEKCGCINNQCQRIDSEESR